MRMALGGISQPKLTFSAVFLTVLALVPAQSATAAQLKEAQITQIVKEVNLLPGQAASRAAVINDHVHDGTAVRTGEDSRTELTFSDQTLARLGANTLFSFNEGTRRLDLAGGAMLLRVPKGAGGATVRTAAVTAAITGTTFLLEYHPKAYIKLIGLEGTVRMYLKGRLGESVLIKPGQMLIVKPDAKRLPDPVDVDLARLMKTCLLITDFPPLGSTPLIEDEIKHQHDHKVDGDLIDTNLVIYGRGTLVTLIDPTSLDTIDQKTNAVRNLGVGFQPIKFGPLPTILTPSPYVINSGTVIQTDPMITTNGQTDFGKIYRGQGPGGDGPGTVYFFGSTSAFDVASGFDSLGETPTTQQVASFKFTSLQISGVPTISLGTGGAKSLALISEGPITSGAPGGTFTFTNMDFVLLATQNGSIKLGNTISFANMPELDLYARGAGSNLTLASPMAGMNTVRLAAEGSIQINADEMAQFFNAIAGIDFLTGTGLITASGEINIRAINNVNFSMARFAIGAGASVFLGDFINTANVTINASANQNLFSNASAVNVVATNAITITGGTTMTFGNSTQADFEAGSGGIQAPTMSFFHPNNGLIMNALGDINVNQILGGAFISANGNVNATANLSAIGTTAGGTISIGGNLTNTQLTQAGGALTVNGTLTSQEVEMTTGADVTADHVSVLLLNQNFTASSTILTAGAGGITPYSTSGHKFTVSTVQSPNGINFSGNNFSTPDSNGGFLQINANTQDFSAAGINGANFDGEDALTPGPNPAGGGGTLTVNTSGNLSVAGANIDATSGIIDTNGTPSGAGGTVNLTSTSGSVSVSNAHILVSSNDAAGSPNRRASASGGNISLTSGATTGVAISITNTAELLSLLSSAAPGPGGIITILASAPTGNNSQINITGSNVGKIEADGGAIDVRHTGDNGVINIANPSMAADIIKIAALGNNGSLNIGGGLINANTVLKLYAPGSNGQINFVASCILNGGTANIIAANSVTINNAVTVNITGHIADVFTNNANYSGFGGNNSTTGTFGGLGANNPQPLSAAPPLGPPGGP